MDESVADNSIVMIPVLISYVVVMPKGNVNSSSTVVGVVILASSCKSNIVQLLDDDDDDDANIPISLLTFVATNKRDISFDLVLEI